MRGHHISFFFFFFTKLVARHLDLIVSENHIPNSQYFKMRIKQNGKKTKTIFQLSPETAILLTQIYNHLLDY